MPTPPVEFKLVPHSEDAHLTTDLDGETAIIQIFSESGIGSADVEIVSEKLPKRIIMRFHLRGMERLRFTYNKTTVEVSLSKAEDNDVFESMVRRDDVTASEPITSDSPYWMNVRLVSNGVSPVTIPLQDGYIEVQVPPSFSVEENHQFSIQWIDFYR